MQRRTFLVLTALGAVASVSGCAGTGTPMSYANDPLVQRLTGSISGLSETQAAGGAGAMLGLAQNRLPAAEYNSIAKTMPNADAYVRTASNAGVTTRDIRDIGGLNNAFAKLGMNPPQARTLLGAVVDWIGKNGGDTARGAMLRAVGM